MLGFSSRSIRLALAISIVISLFAFFQNCTQSSEITLTSVVQAKCTDIRNDFEPALKWDWVSQLSSTDYPTFNQVMASPMVADLDGDGAPEVVFVTYPGAQYLGKGVLRIVKGSTGETLFSVGDNTIAPYSVMSPLLIDLDGDGKMEIVYLHYSLQKVVALNYDGSLRWTWNLPAAIGPYCMQGLSAADVDGDGVPEVIVGNWLIQEDSTTGQPVLKTTLSNPGQEITCGVFASVLNKNNPVFSIINSGFVYDNTGKVSYAITNSAGKMAVGDVRSDIPGNEIVKVTGNSLQIFNSADGTLLTNESLLSLSTSKCPDGSVGGGPASIGDFMGTGKDLQIAVATGQNLMIFDGKGNLLTSYKTVDCSSEETGITAFDFDGDGKPEILYGDEQYFRIFSVVNGQLTVVFETVNPSGTLMEYPVVADLDGDGTAKILVIANNMWASTLYGSNIPAADKTAALNITGLRAFQAAKGEWMKTRPFWNQYHYNAALATDRGKVQTPAVIASSYLSSTFKLNAQLTLAPALCSSTSGP